jgi:hypothetical protein
MDLMNNMRTHEQSNLGIHKSVSWLPHSLKPCLKNDSNCLATPIPAEPAQKNKMRCSVSGLPEATDARCAAFRKPDS